MVIPQTFSHILVTGGAGFIGSHFVDDLLKMGRKVTVFDNLSSGKYEFIKRHEENKSFRFIEGDLLNEKNLRGLFKEKFDTVIHLAANPDISKGIKDPTLDFNQTIIATFNVLMKMKENKIRKLVYFSGSGIYGDRGKTYTAENFGPLLPVSMYGASKLSAEGLISAFSHLYDIQTWIFRPANIVGDCITHGVIFDFIKKLKKDQHELTILGDGNQSKSYLYIRDVLDAVYIALKKTDNKINIFNIATNSFVTVNEIAEIVIKKLQLDDVHIVHTKGKIGWPGDIPIVRIDSKKMQVLGWKPKCTSYEAVQKTVEAFIT